MAVHVPGFGKIEIDTELRDGHSQTIQVFGNDLQVIDQGLAPSVFFSRLLDRDVRLMRADPYRLRPLPERYQRPGAANVVAGADGMPFLLVSQASLDFQHLKNGREVGDVSIDQYRGNIVIGGYAIGAFKEDQIELMKLGDMAAECVKACIRCPIPNIDQASGNRGGSGGLAVLRGRKGKIDDDNEGVCFGQNLNHIWQPGLAVAVGDEVRVLSMADRPNVELSAS